MSCNRNGCDNVMCHRYSSKHGYICHECFKELVQSGAETNIKMFMESEKVTSVSTDAALARFNVEFPEM